VIQRDVDDFLVEVRWRHERRDDLAERIEPLYSSMLGHRVNVHVVDVEELTRSGSGKIRVVESRVGLAQPTGLQQSHG
jgi:hypothetical protein